jgi:RNA polymerase sigma-70 factor (family 1)
LDKFLPDIDLVKRLQSSDLKAFDIIYDRYSGKLYSFGLKYLRSTAEAEELVQSVFLKLWENHKHLNPDLSFKSYIFTITYNDICKSFRRKNYMQNFINEELLQNTDSSLETEQSIEYQSLLSRVQQIVEKLPERQRIIFKKSREEGKTTKEIAKELNLSSGTIDNYISAALSFLRKQLKSEDLALVLYISMFLL